MDIQQHISHQSLLFHNSHKNLFQLPSCQRKLIVEVLDQSRQTHDASVSLEPWASLATLQHVWIPKGRERVYLLQWSSWCLPQRIQQPRAFTATSVASHLENKSIMCKATASNMPTSPVIPDVASRGQAGVVAFWVIEKSGQICHQQTIWVVEFSSDNHSCLC